MTQRGTKLPGRPSIKVTVLETSYPVTPILCGSVKEDTIAAAQRISTRANATFAENLLSLASSGYMSPLDGSGVA